MILPLRMNQTTFVGEECAFLGVSEGMSYKERKEIIDKNNIDFTRNQYEKMGFKIIDLDQLFYKAELPDGWRIEYSDPYWSFIYDDKGRRRIDYFAKTVSYNRDAFCNFYRRYSYSIDCKENSNKEKLYSVSIIDCGKSIRNLLNLSIKSNIDEFKIMKIISTAVDAFMDFEYPNWRDIHAYWD